MPDRPGQSNPEWPTALDDLLGRYWELERLAPGRDPEMAPVAHMQFLRWAVYRLNQLLRRNNCAGYYGVNLTDKQCTVFAPPAPPEIEAAALHAILEWLEPAPTYPPFTRDDEKHELLKLRRRLARAVEVRLRYLEGEADNKADNCKKKRFTVPENREVVELAKRIKKGLTQGRSKIDICREFTEHDEKKAQSLLRQLRRHRWLLE
jgi:hypothetical protein